MQPYKNPQPNRDATVTNANRTRTRNQTPDANVPQCNRTRTRNQTATPLSPMQPYKNPQPNRDATVTNATVQEPATKPRRHCHQCNRTRTRNQTATPLSPMQPYKNPQPNPRRQCPPMQPYENPQPNPDANVPQCNRTATVRESAREPSANRDAQVHSHPNASAPRPLGSRHENLQQTETPKYTLTPMLPHRDGHGVGNDNFRIATIMRPRPITFVILGSTYKENRLSPLTPAQTLEVKRAEVELHNFASLGEPERAIAGYLEENQRRAALIRGHAAFIGPMTPFLEIGANAGHTSYMLANKFRQEGFALDLSADALCHGRVLMERWHLQRAPIRIAGDALNLPFRDGSVRFVLACQMLSQFTDIEAVVIEAKRVLSPGGIFMFTEESLRRLLSIRLFRSDYPNRWSKWERKLFKWGLLNYVVRDVVGSEQEESFGIRQNYKMYLRDWHRIVQRHFVDHRYVLSIPERGFADRTIKAFAIRLDPCRSEWRAAHLLGGTLTALCKKVGEPSLDTSPFCLEAALRCPDCHQSLIRDEAEVLRCACGYEAPLEQGVYNLVRSSDRSELYWGDSEDVIDFAHPSHSQRLLTGWYKLEGVFGNRYRWMGPHGTARLRRTRSGPHRLRVRGHVPEQVLQIAPARIQVFVNGERVAQHDFQRPGIFVIEAALKDSGEYLVEIAASPTWQAPGDDRILTVNLSMIRLVRESER